MGTPRTRKVDLTALPPAKKAGLLAQMRKAQELAGHVPDAADADRFERLLSGELTVEEAYAEVYADLGAQDHLTSAAGAAAAIAEEVAGGDSGFALRLLAEAVTAGFRSMTRDAQTAWLAATPPPVGDPRWLALLAGVAEHLAATWKHPCPVWASVVGPLEEAWYPAGELPELMRTRIRARAWPELARRGVWLDPNDLIAV